MNSFDKLKMAVYESGMDFDDCADVVTILESCPDEELEDAVEAVVEMLEETLAIEDKQSDNKKKSLLSKLNRPATSRDVAAGAVAGAALGAGTTAARYAIKIKTLKHKLKKYTTELSTARRSSDQKRLESQIDNVQNEIRKYEAKLKRLGKQAGAGVAIGAGVAGALSARKALQKMPKRVNSKNYMKAETYHAGQSSYEAIPHAQPDKRRPTKKMGAPTNESAYLEAIFSDIDDIYID